MPQNKCKSCSGLQGCKDTAVSWILLFIGLIATIAIRLVNLVLGFGQWWAKLSWYVGVIGFFIYFLYKFRQDRIVQKELERIKIAEKLIHKETLDNSDYEFLNIIICRLKSTKDTINYFFIFFTSAAVLILAIYQDFIKGWKQ